MNSGTTSPRFLIAFVLGILTMILAWAISPFILIRIFGADGDTLEKRANIGGSFDAVSALFSGVALLGIVVTIYLQQKNATEQAREANETRRALLRAADANVRALHMRLVEMSIESPELAAVWPSAAGLSKRKQKQFMYANLILSHHFLTWSTQAHSHELVRDSLRHLAQSSAIRQFWATTRRGRPMESRTGTPEEDFDLMVTSIFEQESGRENAS